MFLTLERRWGEERTEERERREKEDRGVCEGGGSEGRCSVGAKRGGNHNKRWLIGTEDSSNVQ